MVHDWAWIQIVPDDVHADHQVDVDIDVDADDHVPGDD